jgi:hypothetical protein
MNFSSPVRESETTEGFSEKRYKPDPLPPDIVQGTNRTLEQILTGDYDIHPKRLVTLVEKPGQPPRIETLKGLIFPVKEIREVINNLEHLITSVYFEFCVFKHETDSTKDKFSLIMTGLDKNDQKIRTEFGEVRVYEFAASCPDRCPS